MSGSTAKEVSEIHRKDVKFTPQHTGVPLAVNSASTDLQHNSGLEPRKSGSTRKAAKNAVLCIRLSAAARQ